MTPLDMPVPPHARGSRRPARTRPARFFAIYWHPCGDEANYDDGPQLGHGLLVGYLPTSVPAVALALAGFNLAAATPRHALAVLAGKERSPRRHPRGSPRCCGSMAGVARRPRGAVGGNRSPRSCGGSRSVQVQPRHDEQVWPRCRSSVARGGDGGLARRHAPGRGGSGDDPTADGGRKG